MPCWVLDGHTRPGPCAPGTNTGFSNCSLVGGEVLSPSVRNWGWIGTGGGGRDAYIGIMAGAAGSAGGVEV